LKAQEKVLFEGWKLKGYDIKKGELPICFLNGNQIVWNIKKPNMIEELINSKVWVSWKVDLTPTDNFYKKIGLTTLNKEK